MATVTIRPDGDGFHDGNWTLTGGTAGQAYTTIDESSTDDTDYISNNDTSSPYDKQSVTLGSMPSSSSISSIVIKWRSRCASSTLSTVPFYRLSGADTEKGTPQVVTTTDTEYSWDVTADRSWTTSDVNGLEIGWRRNAPPNNTLRVTQAWVEITYTAGGTTYTEDVGGTLTTAGTVASQVATAPVGTLTSGGTVSSQASNATAGTLSTAGTVAGQVATALAGALETAGDLVVLAARTLSLEGTLTTAGARIQQVLVTLTGALTTSGTVASRVDLNLGGDLTTEGDVTPIVASVVEMEGTLTTAGSLQSQVATGLAGAWSGAGEVGSQVMASLSGVLTTAGDLVADIIPGAGGVVAQTGLLIGRARSSAVVIGAARAGQALVARARRVASIVARAREG